MAVFLKRLMVVDREVITAGMTKLDGCLSKVTFFNLSLSVREVTKCGVNFQDIRWRECSNIAFVNVRLSGISQDEGEKHFTGEIVLQVKKKSVHFSNMAVLM